MTIGEAAARSGVSQRMIRHYERTGLVPPPPRRASGYRDYAADDVARLRLIASARDLGFPTREIGELLSLWADRGRARGEVKALALAQAARLGEKARAITVMRATLLDLAERCGGGAAPDCPIIETLAAGRNENPLPPPRERVG